ncbi:tRNA (guanine(10)-N2)-methyltransferase homolog [Eurytemora carolleeae]|uniref:tRNA (guanine(10)-N2)-methyltransferase homolog n=1 Tax=Eurytemora carolleeae TaxID=1294199 RepID=UPI000C781D5B|nr:tRNA (guanine(10)-N2)-methyltransferase homolog [Eurytemora carolleeae]|eukprot:XP_023327823.1 tRNA (guanine(10)-N2)-methyltransferase homolog [Eurytemora affinis]
MKYLFWCGFDRLCFRIPEFESICRVLKIQLNWIYKNDSHPWVVLELQSDNEAKKILSRSISTKHCIKIWGEGDSLETFHTSLRSFPFHEHTELLAPSNSFIINVETFMKKTSVKERIDKIETLDYVPIEGRVNLKTPDVEYSYLEFWGLDHNNVPDHPLNIFFGLKIGDGQRHLITKQSIKTRKFIGNTTMDAQLALLMANLGGVELGSFTLDPFVGTGSLLLAAAEFGGIVFGGDIDFLTLHARTRPSRVGDKVRAKDESMVANFEQYHLTRCYGDVIACDFSKSPWRQKLEFDCIITDPPYGIRKALAKNINFLDELLPSHPSLEILYNCEQILTSHTSRRLIVMQKMSEVQGEQSMKTRKFIVFIKGDGQRHFITKQSIKTRKFIGNTTMDAQLALLMANLGLVKEGKFILDPFVGTGSLLIAAAQFKGLVFGADINLLTLNAKNRPSRVGEKVRGEDESMIANFEQYGLTSSYGDVIACDFSKSPWRQDLKFDCIITDPPYGIREQIRSVRRDREPPEGREDEVYSLENILQDLLNFSADRLCLGGRLVYWIPIIRQEYKEELLPTHPSLKLVYNCEQVLTAHTSRRLLVMEKIIENTGTAQVHGQLTKFKDQFYIRW